MGVAVVGLLVPAGGIASASETTATGGSSVAAPAGVKVTVKATPNCGEGLKIKTTIIAKAPGEKRLRGPGPGKPNETPTCHAHFEARAELTSSG